MGFSFSAADISNVVNLELSRAWYALGLVTAGLINDRSRREGAACALAALVFPFIAITLKTEPSLVAVMWALGYIFLGFMTVHRVLSFADTRRLQAYCLLLVWDWRAEWRHPRHRALLCGDNVIILVTVTAATAILAILFFLTYQTTCLLRLGTG